MKNVTPLLVFLLLIFWGFMGQALASDWSRPLQFFCQDPKNPEVISIVGGGISGMVLSLKLAEKGCRVILLEARDRLGGRLFTDNQTSFEMGAQWIYIQREIGGSQNPITTLAKELDIPFKESSIDVDRILPESHKIWGLGPQKGHALDPVLLGKHEETIRTFWKDFEKMRQMEEDQGAKDKGISAALKEILEDDMWVWKEKYQQLSEEEQLLFQFQLQLQWSGVYGLDADYLSFQQALKNSGPLYSGAFELEGGMSRLVTELEKKIRGHKRIKILLNHPVTTVNYSGCAGPRLSPNSTAPKFVKIQVRNSPNLIHADAVVLALPIGVLKSRNLKLVPVLPGPQKIALETVDTGFFCKIFVSFSEAFWDSQTSSWVLVPGIELPEDLRKHLYLNEEESKDIWGKSSPIIFDLKNPKTPTLEILLRGKAALQMEYASPEWLHIFVDTILNSIFGDTKQAPIKIERTQWSKDIWSLGSLSRPITATSSDNIALPIGDLYVNLQPEKDLFGVRIDQQHYCLFFTGEYTDRLASGTLQGAFYSAMREYGRIVGDAVWYVRAGNARHTFAHWDDKDLVFQDSNSYLVTVLLAFAGLSIIGGLSIVFFLLWKVNRDLSSFKKLRKA